MWSQSRLVNFHGETVAKMSLKIACWSLLTFLHHVYLFRFSASAVSKLGKKFKFTAACVCVFTFSAKLEEWAYHVTDLPRKDKKCKEIKKESTWRVCIAFVFVHQICKICAYCKDRLWNPKAFTNCGKLTGSVANWLWSLIKLKCCSCIQFVLFSCLNLDVQCMKRQMKTTCGFDRWSKTYVVFMCAFIGYQNSYT